MTRGRSKRWLCTSLLNWINEGSIPFGPTGGSYVLEKAISKGQTTYLRKKLQNCTDSVLEREFRRLLALTQLALLAVRVSNA